MKVILFALLLMSNSTYSQPNFEAVIGALRQADAATLSQYFDTNVQIVLNDKDGSYTKSQATTIIKDFLTTNKPSDCRIAHSGSARDQGSYYCIGKMVANGKNYRINIFFKDSGGKFLIKELRIEEN